jgi:hypothetical protein
LSQQWLQRAGRPIPDKALTDFLVQLVKQAEREVRTVHGLVLPEVALGESQVKEIARGLARRTSVELFVSGVQSRPARQTPALNKVYTSIMHSGHTFVDWMQSKHHRWRLDGDQIRRYHLGDALDPSQTWWERIELPPRACTFYVFRHGASLATLVCEDLARIDPVQIALRAVGPNLVIVLLMDGPQLEARWPGRYATVLADDPGSSVLTLTCLGMVRRSAMPGDVEPRQIALWKEAGGRAQELKLPPGAHALLLTIAKSDEDNFTLDGRSDHKSTVRLSLAGVRGVWHPNPPSWIDY